MQPPKLILASQSIYRAKLLSDAKIPFDQVRAPIDEHLIEADHPATLAKLRAREKALSVSKLWAKDLTIGCDQVLEYAGQAYDKVTSKNLAFKRLRLLSGKTHLLQTAYCLVKDGSILVERVIEVKMKMKDLSDLEIAKYLELGEWQGSVGCYQFENKGRELFSEDIKGSISSIIGLPMEELILDLNGLDL